MRAAGIPVTLVKPGDSVHNLLAAKRGNTRTFNRRGSALKISQNCIELVAGFEGIRLNAYLDPVGIPTIGYGTIRYHTGGEGGLPDRAGALAEIEAAKKAMR